MVDSAEKAGISESNAPSQNRMKLIQTGSDAFRRAGLVPVQAFWYNVITKVKKGAFAVHEIEARAFLSAKNWMNFYRECTHSYIDCDSRSTRHHVDHAFKGKQAGEQLKLSI